MSEMHLPRRSTMSMHSVRDRSAKPPDIQSIAYIRMKSDLSVARGNLVTETYRSSKLEDEIDELHIRLAALARENQVSKSRCVNQGLEKEEMRKNVDRLQLQVNSAHKEIMNIRIENGRLQSEVNMVRRNKEEDRKRVEDLKGCLKESSEKNHSASAALRLAMIYIGFLHFNMDTKENAALHDLLEVKRERDDMIKDVMNTNNSQAEIIEDLVHKNEKLEMRLKKYREQGTKFIDERERKHSDDIQRIEEENMGLGYEISTLKTCNQIIMEEVLVDTMKQDGLSEIEQYKQHLEDCEHERAMVEKELESKRDEMGDWLVEREELHLRNDEVNQELDMVKGSETQLSKMLNIVMADNRFKQRVEHFITGIKMENKGLQSENERLKRQSQERHYNKANSDQRQQVLMKLEAAMRSRSLLFNEVQDLRGNIRVFCRMRPPRTTHPTRPFIEIPNASTGNNWQVICRDQAFSFDKVFQPTNTNSEVYSESAGVVEMVMGGRNVCIIAYGQTGSGKTHTMEGLSSDPGINVLALTHLFRLIREDPHSVLVFLSILEIYNDTIEDLLCDRSDDGNGPQSSRMNGKRGRGLPITRISERSDRVHVPGLKRLRVYDVNDVQRTLRKARHRRSVSATQMNMSSSRSHLIVQVDVQQKTALSTLHLVDLAGSERVSRSKVKGDRLTEAIHINRSLSLLGNVFSALEKKKSHIPYRDCKLTHFLKNSIGGLSKTLMFITVSTDNDDLFETTATLEFGKRVNNIVIPPDGCTGKLQRLRDVEEKLRARDAEIERIRNLVPEE